MGRGFVLSLGHFSHIFVFLFSSLLFMFSCFKCDYRVVLVMTKLKRKSSNSYYNSIEARIKLILNAKFLTINKYSLQLVNEI